jgi:hypothetical protein
MANVDIRQGYKNTAWFTANPTLVLEAGQVVHLEQTGTYKIGDGSTQLSALSFKGGSGGGTWGSITGTLSSQTDLQTALNAKQNSLGFTAENVANKKNTVTNSTTDYPSGKPIYDAFLALLLAGLVARTGRRLSTIYTTLGAGSGWTANSWRAYPFLQTKAIVAIGVEVTGAIAGAKARCAIYSDSGFYPNALLADGGEVDCASLGIKDGVISLAATEQPRWIWLACNISVGTISFRYITSNVNLIGRTSGSGNNPISMYNATGVAYGAPPATYPAGAIERAFQQEGILIEVTT